MESRVELGTSPIQGPEGRQSLNTGKDTSRGWTEDQQQLSAAVGQCSSLQFNQMSGSQVPREGGHPKAWCPSFWLPHPSSFFYLFVPALAQHLLNTCQGESPSCASLAGSCVHSLVRSSHLLNIFHPLGTAVRLRVGMPSASCHLHPF